MIYIEKASLEHLPLLVDVAVQSLLESHAEGAPQAAIDGFINNNLSEKAFEIELQNPANLYHLLFFDKQVAGYSK